MKKSVFFAVLLAGLVIPTFLFAGNSEKETKEEAFAVYKFPAAAIETVTVQTSGGSIRVNGDATDEAVVEVWIRRSSGKKKLSHEEIQQILDEKYTLEVKVEQGTLYAVVKRKSFIRWEPGLSISFTLSVPQQVESSLSTSGGSIDVQNLKGKEVLKTSGGSLKVKNVSGILSGHTSGGSIRFSDCKGEIELSTSGGSIRGEDCEGQITLRTSGGSLNLNEFSGTVTAGTNGGSIRLSYLTGMIHATTSGGSVRAEHIDGTLTTSTSGGSMNFADIAGNLDAKTAGGSINAQMTSVADYVRLSNNGSVTVTLPDGKGYNMKIQGNKIESPVVKNFQGAFESKSIDGTLNGGGAEISIKSSQRVNLKFE